MLRPRGSKNKVTNEETTFNLSKLKPKLLPQLR